MHNPSKSSGAANGEMFLVKIVARLTPWFAPFPSAYFVARSSMEHLQIPLAVAIVIAAIVEFLGLTSVHTWLWLSDWNTRKRKIDLTAPAGYALALGLVYLTATIGLTILLEVFPALSTYAPAPPGLVAAWRDESWRVSRGVRTDTANHFPSPGYHAARGLGLSPPPRKGGFLPTDPGMCSRLLPRDPDPFQYSSSGRVVEPISVWRYI